MGRSCEFWVDAGSTIQVKRFRCIGNAIILQWVWVCFRRAQQESQGEEGGKQGMAGFFHAELVGNQSTEVDLNEKLVGVAYIVSV